MRPRLNLALQLALLGGFGLSALAQTGPSPSPKPGPVQTLRPARLYPLPGGLDARPMFNDNSPESVPGTGILLSTLPGKPGSPFLDYAFTGEFGLFSHHLFIDREPGARLLYLGLIASNLSGKPVRLRLQRGASYLSQPDAPFNKQLPVVAPNPDALLYAGPGDRVASEMSMGKDQYQNLSFTIPPGSSRIISSEPIHTDVPILAPQKDGTILAVNGRSMLMHFHSDGPVHLSTLAWVCKPDPAYAEAKDGGKHWLPPTLDDYRSLLNAAKFAGKHEKTTDYDAEHPPKGAFYYGRVAGVSPGVSWKGRLWEGERRAELPALGETAGYPIATTHVKRFGTGQNQSGPMIKRYPDSPPENHGNYALSYELEIPFKNDGDKPRTFTLSLTEPLNPNLPAPKPGEASQLIYQDPPQPTLMFRGSVHLSWRDAAGKAQSQLSHLSLHNGRLAPPFGSITVAAGQTMPVQLTLIYPADATPPQLLTIERVE